MGNQEIKAAFKEVLDKGFQPTNATTLRETYLPQSFKESTETHAKQFFSVIACTDLNPDQDDGRYLSPMMRKCFPYNSSIAFDNSEKKEDQWDQTARELWQTGYTQWQHNLATLQGDSFKNVVMGQNSDASKYEFLFNSRSLMLCANFMLRFQGGAEVKDIQTFFRETFDQGTNEFAFVTSAQTVFLSIMNGLVGNIMQNPQNLSKAIEALLMATQSIKNESLFSRDGNGMQIDLLFKKIRGIVLQVIQNNDLEDQNLKMMCVELLMRMGAASANPEDLILAAHYQFEFKIDITRHLDFFLKQTENFEEPKLEDEEEEDNADSQFNKTEKKRIQNRVSYEGNGSDRQHPHDKMCCDGQSFYSFCSERGLTRANKKDDGGWEHQKTNGTEAAKKLKYPTFLEHAGNLYLRHQGAPDVPFQILSKSDMKIVEEQKAIVPAEGQENRFKWTTAEDPPLEKEDIGKRWMKVAPMCSDSKFIYTLVYYRADGENSERKAVFCEIYELIDYTIKFVDEIQLFKAPNQAWIPKNVTDEGGYFDHGLLTCNGKQLIWSSPRNYHIFSVKTGERIKKSNAHSGKHLTMFDRLSCNFYTCDADCYSWLDEWKIKGFKMFILGDSDGDEEKEVSLPPVPAILDEHKTNIKKIAHKVKQPQFQLNLFAQLIGDEMETQSNINADKFYENERAKIKKEQDEQKANADEEAQALEEELKKMKESNYLYDYTRAIILSYCSKIARERDFIARAQTKQLDGHGMLKFFKEKYGIQISSSIFQTIRIVLQKVLTEYDMQTCDISEMFTLKCLIHLYISHIGCLKPLKISIRQIMSSQEMEEQQELLKKLKMIDVFPGQKKNPDLNEVVSDKSCYQLHIYHLAQQAVNEMENLISTKTIQEKLEEMLQQLKNFEQQETDAEVARVLKRYTAAEFADIFEEGEDVLGKFNEIFETVLGLIEKRLMKKVKMMLETKDDIDDDFQGFGSEETQRLFEFAFNAIHELMISFGTAKKAILENQPDKDAGEENAQKEVKKARILADAEAKIERLNTLFYEIMIKTCAKFKDIVHSVVKALLCSEFSDYSEDDYGKMINKLDLLLTGKVSILKAIVMFILTIQLYEVDSTDLDEVSEALQSAVEGCRYYVAASDTLSSLNEKFFDANKNMYSDFVSTHRFIAFALSKVACRLVNGKSEQETCDLAKFTILKNGIAEKFIPKLSDMCKKEIEGSFKITQDEELRQSTLRRADTVELQDHDRALIEISQNSTEEAQKLIRILEEGYKENRDSSDELKPNDPLVEDLIRYAFAVMICFQDLYEKLEEAKREDSYDEIHQSIKDAWTKANSMRAWEHKTFDQLQRDLKQSVTEEFKTQYAEENPSKPALEGKLSDEHQKEVDERISKQAKEQLQTAFQDVKKKCEFLVMFETKDVMPKIDDSGIDHANNTALWGDWNPTHAANSKNNRQTKNDDLEERKKQEKIQDEIIQIIQTVKTTADVLQNFSEMGQIRGLRRLAGLVMFNKTFETNDKEIFYDALHMFEASLRDNKAKLCHFLDGVPCCGARTEREIRKQFFKSVMFITQMIRRESDGQKLVNLMNALLWDYQTEDMEVLAKAQVFRTLSGDEDYSYCKFNTLYNAWGKEQRCYSIENRDKSVTDMLEYSLSARLRQCFDFLALKVYSVVYNEDGRFYTNQMLNSICSTLMGRIQLIIFSKFERHLSMLQHNTLKAGIDRDEDIRFDNTYGETADNNDTYMIDQCVQYGENCIEKAEQEYTKKRNSQLKVLEKFIKQLQGEDDVIYLDASIATEGQNELNFESVDLLQDSILKREWRTINWLLPYAPRIAEDLQIEINEDGQNEEEKKADQDDKVASMKQAVNDKSTTEEKVEEWISQMKEQEGKENPLTKAETFSRISIVRMLKHVINLVSLAESSREAAQLLKQVLHPKQLNVLIRLSALGSSQVQCLIQKIFQTLLRCNIKLEYLDRAVKTASSDDETERVKELIERYCESINMRSAFWTFQFNQIYLTRRAQYNTINQVQVGKPAVIEEIIRTFEIVQTKAECEHSNTIRDVIMKSLKEIDRRTDVEIATLFSLVPESHSPIISTGKRCKDVESEDEFICLGFTQADQDHIFETRLSMVQMKNASVVGLIINKGSQLTQIQKSFSLMDVIMVPDIDVSERISGRATAEELKNEQKNITKRSSIYMNPEIVSQLLSRMASKDNIIRNQPEKAISQQFLQTFILNGMFRMLDIFEKEYLIVLKSYNQLETLINFLAKEAANQQIKPDEHLVSASMLHHLVSEVYISATHTSRTTGFFAKFFIYIEEENKKGAFLQRISDDGTQSEFIDINVSNSFGDNGREPFKCEESHEISNIYGGGDGDAVINCKECKESINTIQKLTQKKTGYMRCLECTSDVFYCNECRPNPQVLRNRGLDVSINSLNIFRMSRNEAIFVRSADLATLSDKMLTTMINSNVIIIENNNTHTLESILEKLAKKIEMDNRWKACATCRFLIVSQEDFEKACTFIKGEQVAAAKESRGTLLTKICNKVDIATKRINNANSTHEFVTKFLQDKNVPHAEFLKQNVENILREEINKDFGEEAKEKQREEKKMLDQLRAINEPAQLEHSNSIRNAPTSLTSSSGDKTPDFMKKFTENSDKLIQEGGKEFFNPVKIVQDKTEYRNRFDTLVFESDNRNPGELQRKQLKSCLGKMCQIKARDIWLRLMSEVTNGIDSETKSIINASAMHPKICDLIHDSNMSASYQLIYFGDKGHVKVVREQISKLLKYFDSQQEGSKFMSFFMKDFLKRADLTIDAVRKDNYTELSSYKLQDLRKVSRLPNVFDPNNLLFLSKQIFSLENFLTGNIKTAMAKVVFDLHLGFSILFKSDQDAYISQELVKGCSWALDVLIENIDNFVGNPASVNGLLRSEMIVKLFEFLDENEKNNEQNTNKKKLINEIIIKLNKIFNFTKKRNPDNSPQTTPFNKTEKVERMIDGYVALEHGKKFSSMLPKIKLLSLLTSPIHNSKVSQYGEVFQTNRKMFKTIFKKTFIPDRPIEITVNQTSTKSAINVINKGDNKSIIVDSGTFSQGKPNSIKVAANEEVTIEFPVAINEVKMSGRMMVRGGDDYRKEDYGLIEGTEQICASQVYARHHHAMFVSTDEQVMGMGFRACGREEGAEKLKILERPEDCTGYKKVCAGKFFRLILCNDGKLFFCGQNKKYMIGKDIEVNAQCDKFYEVKDLFPMGADDKIIDVDGGKHFMIVVTEKGRVFTSGYMMYRAVSEIRYNSEDNEDFPCELKLNTEETQGWKAIQCWACDLYCNVWILAEKGGQKKIFAAGGDYDMVGCGDGSAAPKWRSPIFPEGTYMKVLASEGMTAYGIDQDDNLWEWGDHKVQNTSDDDPLWKKPDGAENKRSTPYKFVWFERNQKKPIRIASGKSWALCQTENIGDEDRGKIELYGWAENVNDGRFGKNVKVIYNEKFIMIGNQVNHADVVDFDCSREASYLILAKKIDPLPSILADRPEDRQLVHFYRSRGKWQYFDETDWPMYMDKSPPLIYATRHPIKDWAKIQDDPALIPDLEEILKKANISKSKQPWQGYSTTYGNKPVVGALYYAKYTIDGKEHEIICSYDQVLQGGQSFDMQPIVFYVIRGPIIDPRQLPAIKSEDIFHQSELESEFLRFCVTNAEIDDDEIMNIQTDAEFEDKLEKLRNFDKETDFEIIRAIDRRIQTFQDQKLVNCKETQFDLNNFQLATNSTIKIMEQDLVQNRVNLLFKFSKSVDALLDDTFFEKDVSESSIAYKIKECCTLLLPSVKKNFFKSTLQEYWSNRNMAISCEFNYNRKEAYNFMQKGIKHDPDFINESTFGQLFQICLLRDAEFGMMQNSHNSFNIAPNDQSDFPLQPGDKEEDNASAFAFREIEKELMTDQLPLFIKVANGRHQAGTKRDCYTVNANMTNPEWMKCYQMIGALIGRVIVKDHLWFGVPMAPTFWMLVQDNEKPTLEDFAKEDARLRKRLNKFQEAQKDGVWPDDEGFFWTTCDDKLLPIDRNQYQRPLTSSDKEELISSQPVNGENYEEFCDKLLDRLITENQEQIKHVKIGIKQSLGDFDYLRHYLNWHDLMDLAESKNDVNMNKQFEGEGLERLKENTIYMNCQVEDEQIKMFWQVYAGLNYEDKKGYLNLVSGKSRLGDKNHRYAMSHRIRVDSSMAEGDTPKSKASQFELILAPNYENADAMKAKLLEAITKGCGLEPDQD